MKYIKNLLKWGKRTAIRLIMLLSRVCPVDPRKVMIVSYYGKGFGDNGKAIALKLMEKRPDVKIVWAVTEGQEVSLPAGIQPVRYDSVAYYFQLATAKVWIDNARKHRAILKRKGQYYIQTWHGCLGLKRTEAEVEDQLAPEYVLYAKHDSKLADVFLSGCGFFTKLVRRAYWYDGEILECGSPRLDALVCPAEGTAGKVKAAFGLSADTRIVLYVPTFRANHNTDCYRMDFERVLEELERKTGEKWAFCVRLHPNISHKADFIRYSDAVKNATPYPDQYELVTAADAVISDYSSIMFEAGMLGKTTFLFATDIAEYVQDRGFSFRLEELPFPLAEDNEQLLGCIREFDAGAYAKKTQAFYLEQQMFENGTAAETVVERIESVIGK